jgi:hypothetical protein
MTGELVFDSPTTEEPGAEEKNKAVGKGVQLLFLGIVAALLLMALLEVTKSCRKRDLAQTPAPASPGVWDESMGLPLSLPNKKLIVFKVPPGPLGITFKEKNAKQATGVFLSSVSESSSLKGAVVGSHLISINGIDVTSVHMKELHSLVVNTAAKERTLVFEDVGAAVGTATVSAL